MILMVISRRWEVMFWVLMKSNLNIARGIVSPELKSMVKDLSFCLRGWRRLAKIVRLFSEMAVDYMARSMIWLI